MRLEVEGERLEVEGERLEAERLEVEAERLEVEGLRPLLQLSNIGGLEVALEVVVVRWDDVRPEERLEDTELEETQLEDARLVLLSLKGPWLLLQEEALRSEGRKVLVLSWPRNMAHSSSRVPKVPQIRDP